MKRQRRLPRLATVTIRWMLIRFGRLFRLFPTLQGRICQCKWFKQLCRLKEGAEAPTKKVLESAPLATAHATIWSFALIWLVLEALLLLDGNFTIFSLEQRLAELGRHHVLLEWLLTDARPVWTLLILTGLREVAHRRLRLKPDQVKANSLIRAWVCILGGTVLLTNLSGQKFVFVHSAQEATAWLAALKFLMYLSRRNEKDKATDTIPSKKVSRIASWVNAILRMLLKNAKK